MLKEYEKLYSHVDLHYNAVEKTINFYFVLIGAIISLASFTDKSLQMIGIFDLSQTQLLLLFIISIMGTVIYLKVIEHRLLVIAYVKSLNLNRKWFEKHSEDSSLSNFLYFRTGVYTPPFYKKFRHFYWEAVALGLINSLIVSVLLINIIKNTFNFQCNKPLSYNCVFLVLLSIILTYLHLLFYKKRGRKEELALRNRFAENT